MRVFRDLLKRCRVFDDLSNIKGAEIWPMEGRKSVGLYYFNLFRLHMPEFTQELERNTERYNE